MFGVSSELASVMEFGFDNDGKAFILCQADGTPQNKPACFLVSEHLDSMR